VPSFIDEASQQLEVRPVHFGQAEEKGAELIIGGDVSGVS